MSYGRMMAASLAALGICIPGAGALTGCAGATVEVTALRPAPRPLAPRPVETVKTFDSRPDDGVAVYSLVATGSTTSEQEKAVRAKAASLGCDGLVVTVRAPPSKTQGEAATGQLNDHREMIAGHVTATCVVLTPPAPAAASS